MQVTNKSASKVFCSEREIESLEAELIAEEIALGLRHPDGAPCPEPERPKRRRASPRPSPPEKLIEEWGAELAEWMNRSDARSKRPVVEHLADVQGGFAVARKNGLEIRKGDNWFVRRSVVFRVPHVSLRCRRSFKLLYDLAEEGEVWRVRPCVREKCRTWFFASKRPDHKYCCNECRNADWLEHPDHRKDRATAAKKRRDDEKKKDEIALDTARNLLRS